MAGPADKNGIIVVIIVFSKLDPNQLDFGAGDAIWYGLVARQNNKHLSLADT